MSVTPLRHLFGNCLSTRDRKKQATLPLSVSHYHQTKNTELRIAPLPTAAKFGIEAMIA
jgi:hypothetical protein